MTAKITVKEFTVEAESEAAAAWLIARHFGRISDGEVPDAGVAIAHMTEYTDEEGEV